MARNREGTSRAPKNCITQNNQGGYQNLQDLWEAAAFASVLSNQEAPWPSLPGPHPPGKLLSPARVKAGATRGDGVRNFTLLLFVVKKSTNSF